MQKQLGLLLIVLFGSVLLVQSARTATAAFPDLQVSSVADGFNQPVDIANAGDDRLFVVERAGVIKIIDVDGSVLATPFLDIRDRVDSTTHGEMGLLGLVFHPDYPDTPYFYVNYTAKSGGDTHIARFTVTADPYVADPDSEFTILTQSQPQPNHNAGDLAFGPDGYLYVPLGDGGGAGDDDPGHGTVGNGQDPTTLLGKILRLDVDGGAPYTIPPDNPFVGDAGAQDEIWALGLRNPWRFSFDRVTGDLYIADVGQNEWEEVNFQPASSSGGENYGWRCYEGTHDFDLSECDPGEDFVVPFDDYPHSNSQNAADQGSSVTGGFVYRGSDYPDLQGIYVYADFITSNVWLAQQESSGWTVEPIGTMAGLSNPSTFGEGCDGELYVAGYGGTIFQMQTAVASQASTIAGDNFIYLPLVAGGTGAALACSG